MSQASHSSHKHIGHPSPHRLRVGLFPLVISLLGAPGAWIIQMLGSEVLAGNGCIHQGFAARHLMMCLYALSITCFFIGTFSCITAWVSWLKAKHELEGESKHVMNIGEGRTRFLVLLGVFSSLIFIIAILFTGSALVLVAPCV